MALQFTVEMVQFPIHCGLEILVYDRIFEVFLFSVCAHKHNIPISEPRISPYPSFGNHNFVTKDTLKENAIVWHGPVYALPRFLTAADYLSRHGLSQVTYHNKHGGENENLSLHE